MQNTVYVLIFARLLTCNKIKQKRDNSKELAVLIFVMHFALWKLLLKTCLHFLIRDFLLAL